MNFRYENRQLKLGYRYIIGCDEVGRGCLAGPVVAAAVVLKAEIRPKWFSEINDSKKLSTEKREYLSALIKAHSLWSIGEVSSDIVDSINIHNASLLAMKRAVEGLLSRGVIPSECSRVEESLIIGKSKIKGSLRSSAALVGRDDTANAFLAVDGKFKVPNIEPDQEAIIGGDNKVLSIAAASIVAKVHRDQLMRKLHQTYPAYNFFQHKGYATQHHRAMVLKHGLSPIHRLSFCERLTA